VGVADREFRDQIRSGHHRSSRTRRTISRHSASAAAPRLCSSGVISSNRWESAACLRRRTVTMADLPASLAGAGLASADVVTRGAGLPGFGFLAVTTAGMASAAGFGFRSPNGSAATAAGSSLAAVIGSGVLRPCTSTKFLSIAAFGWLIKGK